MNQFCSSSWMHNGIEFIKGVAAQVLSAIAPKMPGLTVLCASGQGGLCSSVTAGPMLSNIPFATQLHCRLQVNQAKHGVAAFYDIWPPNVNVGKGCRSLRASSIHLMAACGCASDVISTATDPHPSANIIYEPKKQLLHCLRR